MSSYVLSLVVLVLTLFPIYSRRQWTPWSDWSQSCRRLCIDEYGKQTRQRHCYLCYAETGCFSPRRTTGSKQCPGTSKYERKCYQGAVCDGPGRYTGEWSKWQKLGACQTPGAKMCIEFGKQYFTRECLATKTTNKSSVFQCPVLDGLGGFKEDMCETNCTGASRKRLQKREVGQWSTWTSWTCQEDCVRPDVIAYRNRECIGAVLGNVCQKSTSGIGPVDPSICLENGVYKCRKTWAEWSQWSGCQPDCGIGARKRTRECTGYGGPCEGQAVETLECRSDTPCVYRDGAWNQWSIWAQSCSATCGKGKYTRYRECNNPAPSGGGKNCSGHDVQARACTATVVCAANGAWSKWSKWICDVTCGKGREARYRECNNPAPVLGGLPCPGESEEIGDEGCNDIECPLGAAAPKLPFELREAVKKYLDTSHHSFEKSVNDTVEFVCKSEVARLIEKTFPRTNIYWVKNGHPLKIDPSRMTYDQGDLLFQKISADDTGVYLCQLEWKPNVLQTVGVFSLAVKSNKNFHVRLHERMLLLCNGAPLGLLYPGLQQVWFHDGTIYKDYDPFPPQTVNEELFPDVTEDLAGLWECTISDPKSDRFWTTNVVNVTVGPPLSIFEKFTSNNVYLYGSIGIVVCLALAVIVSCVYLAKRQDVAAENEVEAFQQLLNPEEKKSSTVTFQEDSNINQNKSRHYLSDDKLLSDSDDEIFFERGQDDYEYISRLRSYNQLATNGSGRR